MKGMKVSLVRISFFAAIATCLSAWPSAMVSDQTTPRTSCADLTKLQLPDTTITAAEEILGGQYAPAGGRGATNLPAFCRVALTVAPAIRIEIWLPRDTWNGRYRGEGGGGYAGNISDLSAGLRAGYATA